MVIKLKRGGTYFMKSFKKVLAIALACALLLTNFTSFAADGLKYEKEGEALWQLGLMQGYSETEMDLGLDKDLTREAAMKLIASILGWEVDMEATTVFADVSNWAQPYVAVAVEKGVTNGISETEFGGSQVATMHQLVTWFLRALGYEDAYANAATLAMTNNLVTANELIKFEDPILRDDFAGVAYKALTMKPMGTDVTLIEQLVAKGTLTAEQVILLGLMKEPEPEKLEVVSVEALTLVQTAVTFNLPLDEESAIDTDNYDMSTQGGIDLTLLDDEMTVVVTHAKVDNQGEATLEVDGVLAKDKESSVEDYEVKVEYTDFTMPTVESCEVIGTYLFEVKLSEPVSVAEESAVTIKDMDSNKKLYVDSVLNGKGEVVTETTGTDTLYVKVYSKLEEGDYEVAIAGGIKDFAGYAVKPFKEVVSVGEDKTGPKLIGYEDVTSTEVTLIFDEALKVETILKKDIYHTNATKKAKEDVQTNGNKLKIEFEKAMGTGTVYVTVASDKLMDNWGNLAGTIIATIEREVDVEAPVIDKVSAPAENKIKLTFNESVDEDSAETKSNYEVKDSDGDKVDVKTLIHDGKTVTLVFADDLVGLHTIAVKGVEDLAGNECDVATEIDVTDSTEPLFVGATMYGGTKEVTLIVRFNEPMSVEGQYSVLDLGKYVLNTKQLDDIDDVEIDATTGGKVVEISIPTSAVSGTSGHTLKIAKVADEEGNTTSGLLVKDSNDNTLHDITDGSTGSVDVAKVELTASDMVKFSFGDALAVVKAEEFVLYTDSDDKLDISSFEVGENSSGNTTITVTLKDDLETTAPETVGLAYKVVPAGDDDTVISKNEYGEPVDKTAADPVKDKAAPAVALNDDDKPDVTAVVEDTSIAITINFTEKIFGNKNLFASDLLLTNSGNTLVYKTDFEMSKEDNKLTILLTPGTDNTKDIFENPGNHEINIELVEPVNYLGDGEDGNMVSDLDLEVDLKDHLPEEE